LHVSQQLTLGRHAGALPLTAIDAAFPQLPLRGPGAQWPAVVAYNALCEDVVLHRDFYSAKLQAVLAELLATIGATVQSLPAGAAPPPTLAFAAARARDLRNPLLSLYAVRAIVADAMRTHPTLDDDRCLTNMLYSLHAAAEDTSGAETAAMAPPFPSLNK
jgi:hypothetical protein